MEYQKRLKFINYIKKKYIDTDPNCKWYKGFYFKNYDDLESIEMVIFENADLSVEYFTKFRYEDVGACVFTFDHHGAPCLDFEDSYMTYLINLMEYKCDYFLIKESFKSDKKSLQMQLNAFIRQLNCKDPAERAYNC